MQTENQKDTEIEVKLENDQAKDDFEVQMEEALKLEVFIPPFARKFENLYKLAYYQVKNDARASALPSSQRKKLVINLMNSYIKNIHQQRMEALKEAQKLKTVEVEGNEG
jgi:hypothetical protein